MTSEPSTRRTDDGTAPRAPRFPVHVSVRYRSPGQRRWSTGRIENISRSGMLFWTEQLLPVDTPLEILFMLPLGGLTPGVACRGRVVRTVDPLEPQLQPGIAATITAYRFVRRGYGSA